MTKRFDPSSLIKLCALALQSILLLSFSRLYFYVSNDTFFSEQDASDIIKAFVHGVRFDASSTALGLAIFVLLYSGLSWAKWFQGKVSNALLWIVVVITSAFLIINTFDAEYFPYTGKRSGPEVFDFWGDVKEQLSALIFTYWFTILVCVVLVSIHVYLYHRFIRRIKVPYQRWYIYLIVVFCAIFLTLLAGRGSMGGKPIRPLHAYSWPTPKLGALVSNTVFTLMKEEPGTLVSEHYFPSDKEAFDQFFSPIVLNVAEKSPKNVVIILLESFGMEYFGPPYSSKSYMPFLNELAKESVFFPYGIANGRRSIEAIPSVLSGLPSLLDEAYMRSSYQDNHLIGLGETLENYGYDTAFFHGANNGSMYFDATTQRLGFKHYFGRNEYNNESDFDGQWGIFDEPFLQYTVQQLGQLSTPFAAGIFTISSHTPYTIPKVHKGRFADGEIPMHRAVEYSDYALRKFFESARQQDWFDDTLFVITADHTSDNYEPEFRNIISRHQVPILLYGQDIQPSVRLELGQQIDIPTTVIDYLNLPEQHSLLPFGRSLLENAPHGRGFFQDQEAYWLLAGTRYVKMSKHDKSFEFGDLPSTFTRKGVVNLSNEKLQNMLQGMVQVYTNAMISDSFYSFYH